MMARAVLFAWHVLVSIAALTVLRWTATHDAPLMVNACAGLAAGTALAVAILVAAIRD
jgi:hypothetical protein